MGRYLSEKDIQQLITIRNNILPLRSHAYQQFGIDILDNDTLSSLSIWEIVKQYDTDYNTNFARNGEDAVSNDIIIEQKCSSIKPTKAGVIGKTAFQFHAMGNLEYPRYILVVRSKDTLDPVRMYDISKPENTQIIATHLLAARERWLEKGRKDEVKNMKYDVITLPETLIEERIKLADAKVINNCQVFKD